MELLVVLALFVTLAVLGPWLGVDTRAPGGWTPTDEEGKLWADRPRQPDRPPRRARREGGRARLR